MTKPILVLGIGNILLKDEGIGVRVAEQMMKMSLPPDVEVMDGGVGGLNLLDYIEARKKVIVVDTVKAGTAPGTLFRFTDRDLSDKKGFIRSAHGIDFSDVIAAAGYLGTKPDAIVFIGIEPETLDASLELSPKMAEMIPVLINLVMKEIARGGEG
ncbi:MAG: hydrogenase maturation protease [Nitrospirota bacterium]